MQQDARAMGNTGATGLISVIGGRTRRLWAPLMDAVTQDYRAGDRVVLVVPEQYTLQAERDCLKALNVPGFFRLEVFSPSGLMRRVFERAGRQKALRLTKEGQQMAVARAISAATDKLSFYGGVAARTGFAPLVRDFFSHLKQGDVSVTDILQMSEEADTPALSAKLLDLALLYGGYQQVLGDRFMDDWDVTQDMLSRLADSGLMTDARVFFYGFDSLSDGFLALVLTTSAVARSTALYLDWQRPQDKDGAAFVAIAGDVNRLARKAAARGITVKTSVLPDSPLEAPAVIRHVEAHFLGMQRPPFTAPSDALRLRLAATPYAEARFVAREIKQLMLSGVAPGEIIVIAGRLAPYEGLLAAALSDYAIPFYIAKKEPLTHFSAARFLISALRAVRGYRRPDVLAVVKSGVAPLTDEQQWLFEQYVRRFHIQGTRFLTPFDRGEPGDSEPAEAVRQIIIPLLTRLQDGLREARDPAQSLEAVMGLLREAGVYESLVSQQQRLSDKGLLAEAMRLSQVWQRLIDILDEMHQLMDGARIPLQYMAQWLQAGLEGQSLSALPPAVDCVEVGELGKIMPRAPRVTFVMGLCDGLLSREATGLMTLEEDATLREQHGLEMGWSQGERERAAMLDLYKALASPREKLILSYPLADEEGHAQRPLAELKAVRELCPLLTEEGGALAEGPVGAPLSTGEALDQLSRAVSRGLHMDDAMLDKLAALSGPERAQMAHIDNAARTPAPQRLAADLAQALYRAGEFSVSRLESYWSCPFKHFVTHGLRPREDDLWQMDARLRGSLLHQAMEQYLGRVMAHPDWPRPPEEVQAQIKREVAQDIVSDWRNSPYQDGALSKSQADKALDEAATLMDHLKDQAEREAFLPRAVEARFGKGQGMPPLTIETPDGDAIALRGVIDRVDEGTGHLLRVVDYKSSGRRLEGGAVDAGLDLQLLIYLAAASGSLPDKSPVAAVYQPMKQSPQSLDEPPLDIDLAREKARGKVTGDLRYAGVILQDEEAGLKMSDMMPSAFKKNGESYKQLPAVTAHQLKGLMDLALQRAGEAARHILSGDISPLPAAQLVSKKRKTACQTCEHAAICRRDPWRDRQLARPVPEKELTALVSDRPKEETP